MTSYRITPYVGSTAQTPTTVTRHAAGDEQDDRRPDDRARPTRSRSRRSTPTAPGRRRRSPTPVTPAGAGRAARRRPASAREPGHARPRASSWTRAQQRRRQPDHRLHRHAVHRRGGADAGPGRRVGDEHDDDRARPTGPTTRSRSRRRTTSAPARPRPPRPRSRPQDTIFDFATPATVDAGDTQRGRGRREVPQPTSTGTVTGIRFYKAAANTGTHVGSLWTAGGTRLGSGDVHRRDGVAAGSSVTFASPVDDHRRARPTSPPTSRRTATTRSPAAASRPPSTTRRCRRSPNGTSANGVFAYGAASTFPTSSFNASELLGRRAVRSPAGGAGPGHRRARRRPGRPRRASPGPRPPTGGAADVLRRHAVHRLDGADAEDRHRHAAGDEQDDHRADRRARRTRSRCAASNPGGVGPGLGAVELGHADRRRRAGGADRRHRRGRHRSPRS